MFSKEYLTYLLKSKKYLLLLIVLITLLNVLGNAHNAIMMFLQGFFTIVLAFAVPIDVFYHVHNKKAVDTFFSIPVSRKALLGTGIIFSFLVVYLPFACGIIRYGTAAKDVNTFLLLSEMALTCLTTVVFNTMLYLIGNNLVDGVIMVGAYTCMPIAIIAILNSFVFSYVAGLRSIEFYTIRFLSPICLGAFLFDSGVRLDSGDIFSIIALIVILAVSAYLLYKSYVDRAAERADSQSTAFFSFPFVINFYLIICLFLIASFYNMNYSGLKDFLQDLFVPYLLLFAVFVAAYFVYRRKFYFSYKLPLFYIVMLVISLLCASVCMDYKAFGLSNKYTKAHGKDYCSISIWTDYNNEIYNYIRDLEKTDPQYVQIFLEVGAAKENMIAKVAMSDETSDIIDELRKDAIEYFYENKSEISDEGMLYISNRDDNKYYNYRMRKVPDLDVIKKLAKDPAVDVTITTDNKEYQMLPDGTLKVLFDYSEVDVTED